ncbi:protein of unknown function [Taphrina deformans PYCC 5710]|uniref:Probable vacuolar protein sorting-associated protein 16 homolog n=1 Tax=Taphrina deformans (strain PYCC 5710 / ATCC 11124 / CBS 356.35 / IMI 108563 / JCM 9778 / NBRC 8474) TaxID=1097556 RepID=R4XFZ7_TAPDE|nr:protein of unknown function [Taphrina deformans PYCC 5710]|eukprot:CCG84590.1 protein of unknown function [Taphrina deformans PYCC 5710]
MEPPPSYEWDELGSETYYHKFELYKLSWPEVDLSGVIFAAASYGGAIAVTRDDEKFQKYRGQSQLSNSTQVFSSVGQLLRDIRWEGVSIRSLGWTDEERLLIVSKEGLVRYYDLLGNFSQFSLTKNSDEGEVIECKFWNSGMIARMSNNAFIKIDNYREPRPHVLLNTHLKPESVINSWTITAPAFTVSRQAECLVSLDKTIISLDGADSQDLSVDHGPFTHLQSSPNGQFLALRRAEGNILVASSDLQRTLTDYDAGEEFVPSQLSWCGNDALAASDDTILTVIGPSGETLRYAYESALQLSTDVDGVRVFSSTVCDFLRKVPDTSERIFAPGSTSAASILLDAFEQLELKSAKADENIRLIQSYLTEAVDDCIKAAGESLTEHWQKQLLKSATFGKGFLELYNSDEFVDTCESLRIMNAVKFHEVGIPLTMDQYIRITPEGLVDRLLQRKHHYLASRICEYLGISSDHVYVHWACLKLQNSDEEATTTCEAIVSKLGSKKQISYEKIARTAFADGRLDLSMQLLAHEPRAGAQVSLLLDMDQEEAALSRAITSGDPDLLAFVVFHIKSKHSLATFLRFINDKPAATAVALDHARKHDKQFLKDYYYQDDSKVDGSDVVLMESLVEHDRAQQYTKTKLALRMINETKDHSLETRMLEDAAKLIHLQDTLAKELGMPFAGTTVNELLLKVLSTGNLNKAQKIASAFKVSDLTFTWLQLQSFVSLRDWSALEKWIFRMKSSPVPFEVVAGHVHSAGNKKLAAQIVTKCNSPALRIETYMKLDEPLLAAREAYKIKDLAVLDEASAVIKDGAERGEVDDMLRRLQESR